MTFEEKIAALVAAGQTVRFAPREGSTEVGCGSGWPAGQDRVGWTPSEALDAYIESIRTDHFRYAAKLDEDAKKAADLAAQHRKIAQAVTPEPLDEGVKLYGV